jgi:hypothetical protein
MIITSNLFSSTATYMLLRLDFKFKILSPPRMELVVCWMDGNRSGGCWVPTNQHPTQGLPCLTGLRPTKLLRLFLLEGSYFNSSLYIEITVPGSLSLQC